MLDFFKVILCGCMYVRVCLCMCVCVRLPPRLLITSGVIWIPYDWLNKFYSFYVAAVVGIVSRHGLALMRVVRTNLITVI